jgi:hypothetical protein
VKIPRRPRKGPTHVVVDSTGLKIFGEGEWKVRQHGVGKRRTWRKIHLAVDETTKDIIGIEVTTADWGDSEILPGLLDQVEGEIAQVSADGAYDSHGCHAAIAERDARATIPPRDGAVPGETIIPATRSSRRSKPREAPAGRTIAATTGAASPRT